MAFTRPQLRAKLYNLGIGLGKSLTLDGIRSDGMAIVHALELTGRQPGYYNNMRIIRPLASEVNIERIALEVENTSQLTHYGPAYTDAAAPTTLLAELLGRGVAYSELNDVLQRALRIIYFHDYWPLGWGEDNDFSSASTTTPYNWETNSSAITTFAKVRTAGEPGQSGQRNLRLTGSGAGNGYCEGPALAVESGDTLFHGTVGRCNDAGTARYQLINVNSGAAIFDHQFASRAFQRIAHEDTVPSGCTQVRQRFGNVTASGVTEWDSLFGHFTGSEAHQIYIPSFLNERDRVLGFGPATYRGRLIATDRWNAGSREFQSLKRGARQDWEVYPVEEAASPQYIQVNRSGGLDATDYWLYCLRQRSDAEALDNETDSTNAGEDEVMEAIQYLLYDLLHTIWIRPNGESEWLERREYWRDKVTWRRLSKALVQNTPTDEDRGMIRLTLRG